MKLPEGWPTEAMITAGKRAIEKHRRDQDQSLNNLVEWVFRYMFATAPTPPAQEDEPVAIVRLEEGERIIDLTRIMELPIGTKLYTRPADDKLRKAAEEFVDYFNPGADADRSLEQIAAFLQAYERKLRDALEEQ